MRVLRTCGELKFLQIILLTSSWMRLMLSRSGVVPFALIIFESGQSTIYSTKTRQRNPVLAVPTAVITQSTPFSKVKMIPQKLDHFYELFGPNKSGGLWLSATVPLKSLESPSSKNAIFNNGVFTTAYFGWGNSGNMDVVQSRLTNHP